MRITFCGPSGTGKSTLAKELSKHLNIESVDGSRTTLMETDRGKTHQGMLSEEIVPHKNFHVMNKRARLFQSIESSFVSDRSMVDPVVYEIYETSAMGKSCTLDDILDNAKYLLAKSKIDLVIYIPYTNRAMDEMAIEDNNKRITNPYFQRMISKIFDIALERLAGLQVNESMSFQWGKFIPIPSNKGNGHETKLLVINEPFNETRMKIIKQQIKNIYG